MTNEPQFIEVEFPQFKVTLCSLGASIYSIEVNGLEMLSTFKDKNEWLFDGGYHGKTVGRVAGRIPNGIIEIDSKLYQVDINERGNCLHGGKNALSYKNFDVHVEQFITHYEVTYTYNSPNMENGFPGDVEVEVIYRVYRNKTIEIFHNAKSNKKTPINLTQHLYFNLGEKNLDPILMQINASKRYLLDDNLLRIKLVDVKNTAYDFKEGKMVMEEAFAKEVEGPHKFGFDDIWYLGNTNKNYPCAKLESPRYVAEFYTDYDATVIYMNGYPSITELKTNRIEEQYSAITMELTNSEPLMVSPLKPYKKYSKIVFKEK